MRHAGEDRKGVAGRPASCRAHKLLELGDVPPRAVVEGAVAHVVGPPPRKPVLKRTGQHGVGDRGECRRATPATGERHRSDCEDESGVSLGDSAR